MDNLYYVEPTATAFAEMKQECTKQWQTHDDSYGYATKKIARIKDIPNVQDNFMHMLAMFDQHGQKAVITQLSPETKQAVRERLEAGGNDDYYITQLGL